MNYLSKNKIIHRDLKPENFMFESKFHLNQQDVKKPFIKVIDFGYSLDLRKEMTQYQADLLTQLIMGTLTYLAPEMFTADYNNISDYNTLSDMWSIGVIIYTLVCRSHPFDGSEEETKLKILTTDYQFQPNDIWDQVSYECKDLIQ